MRVEGKEGEEGKRGLEEIVAKHTCTIATSLGRKSSSKQVSGGFGDDAPCAVMAVVRYQSARTVVVIVYGCEQPRKTK